MHEQKILKQLPLLPSLSALGTCCKVMIAAAAAAAAADDDDDDDDGDGDGDDVALLLITRQILHVACTAPPLWRAVELASHRLLVMVVVVMMMMMMMMMTM